MRKTQFALAALALVASTAALADGVTVYGTVDASVVNNSSGTAFAGQGNSAGSLFGLKGTEDLGGGLKASFNLEAGYNASTGALGGNGGVKSALFNRAANVSLSNSVVSTTLGTQISPFISGILTGATGVGGNGIFVPGLARVTGNQLAGIKVAGETHNGFFISDAVSASVTANGFTGTVLYRVKPKTTTDSEYTAASLTGSVANVNLALAYQAVASSTALDRSSSIVIAANTNIGDVRVNAAYGSNSNDGVTGDTTGFLVGASMPLMGAVSGGLTYATNSKLGLGSQTSASLQYNLSKQTYAYTSYSAFSKTTTVNANDNGGLTTGKYLLAVGVAHSF